MRICCFPYCAVLYFITIRIVNVTNDKDITIGTFITKGTYRCLLKVIDLMYKYMLHKKNDDVLCDKRLQI